MQYGGGSVAVVSVTVPVAGLQGIQGEKGDDGDDVDATAAIAAEAAARTAGDDALTVALGAEATARSSADTAEASARSTADSTEMTDRIADVDAEESRATAAEGGLDARTGALESADFQTEGQVWGIANAAVEGEATARAAGDAAQAPGAWQTLSLPAGMAAGSGFQVPAYRLEGDRVRFRGRISCTSAYTSGNTIDTLPSNYRPSAQVQMTTRATSGQTSIQVNSTGAMSCVTAQTSGAFINLDGLSFVLA